MTTGFATWALAQARAGERILWVGSGQDAPPPPTGCELRVEVPEATPERLARLRAYAPHWVVLAAAPSPPSMEALLRDVFAAAAGARVLLELYNPASSAALLRTAVSGAASASALTPEQLAACLEATGGRVQAREALPDGAAGTGLASGTEAAVQALLRQLSDGAAEAGWRCILVKGEGVVERPPAATPGLLSVLLEVDEAARPARLDALLFSLACQDYRPFELVLCGSGAARAQAQAERYRTLEDFALTVAQGALATALQAARGQYLAILSPDCVVYPAHFVQLVGALRAGERAWSLARPRYARIRPDDTGFVEHKEWAISGDAPSLAQLAQVPALLHALVVDRSRIGRFPLLSSGALAAMLPLRLAALFEPAFVGGVPTLEVQHEGAEAPRLQLPAPGLQALRSVQQLLELAQERAEHSKPVGLRHRMLDELNAQLRHRAPGMHARLKDLARRWLRDAEADRS